MCSELTHDCRFCHNEYHCKQDNYICPTINGDRDANMCDACKARLEQIIEDNELDVALHTLEDMMKMEME